MAVPLKGFPKLGTDPRQHSGRSTEQQDSTWAEQSRPGSMSFPAEEQ